LLDWPGFLAPTPGGGGIGLPDGDRGGRPRPDGAGGGGMGLPEGDSGGPPRAAAGWGPPPPAGRGPGAAPGRRAPDWGPLPPGRACGGGSGRADAAGTAVLGEGGGGMGRAGRGATSGRTCGSGRTVTGSLGRLVIRRESPGRSVGAGVTGAGMAAAGTSGAGAGAGAPPAPSSGAGAATAVSGGAALVERARLFASFGSSGWCSRMSPSRAALRRTRSACASSMLDEWLLTPMPSASDRSRASLFVRPSSRASSYNRIFLGKVLHQSLLLAVHRNSPANLYPRTFSHHLTQHGDSGCLDRSAKGSAEGPPAGREIKAGYRREVRRRPCAEPRPPSGCRAVEPKRAVCRQGNTDKLGRRGDPPATDTGSDRLSYGAAPSGPLTSAGSPLAEATGADSGSSLTPDD